MHSEWSWDTGGPRSDAAGRMEAMCHRAVKMGLPALAFTEHLDITGWAIGQEDLLDHLRPLVDANGVLTPDPLDALHTLPVSDTPGAVRSEPITLYRRWS